MKLSISDMFFNVSTYNGNLDFSELENESIESDIEEGYLPEGIDYNDIPYDFITDFKKELSDDVDKAIRKNKKIMTAFKKYRITYNGTSFYSPREYNFKNDSINIDIDVKKDCKALLKTEIQYYIDNIRQKSYDGYMSLEPSKFEDVNTDDYCYLWAICKKEDLIDDFTDILSDTTENAYEIYNNHFYNALYKHIESNPIYIEFLRQKAIIENNQTLSI